MAGQDKEERKRKSEMETITHPIETDRHPYGDGHAVERSGGAQTVVFDDIADVQQSLAAFIEHAFSKAATRAFVANFFELDSDLEGSEITVEVKKA
jgi:hypothetical protein